MHQKKPTNTTKDFQKIFTGVPTKHAVVTKHGHHFPVCRNSTASEFSTFSTSPESVSSFLQLKKKTPSRKESLTDYIQNLRDKLYACSSEHSSEVILYNSETSCAQYSQSGTAQSAYQGSEEDHQADSEEDSESPIAKTLCGMPLDALCGPRHDFQPLRDEIGPEMRRVQKVAFAHYTLGENKAAKLIHALTFHSKASSLRFNDCRITACLGFNALGKALSQTPIKHLIIEQEPYLGENGVAKIIEEVLLADCDNGGKSDGNKNNGNIIESLTFIDVGLKLFHDDMNALDPDRQLRRAFMEVSDLRGVGPFEKRPLRIIFASSEEYIFNVASIKALIERTKWRVSERVSDEMTQSAGGKTYRSLQFHLSDREGDCE